MPRKDQGGVVNLLGTMSATLSGSVEPADPKGLSSLGATGPPRCSLSSRAARVCGRAHG